MNQSRERVLVVDDHPFVGHLLKAVLNRYGYQAVDLCRDPQEALNRSASRNYAVAFVDLMLNGKSGLDLFDQIHARHPDLPVVMMTEGNLMDVALESIRRGAYHILEKPLHPEKIRFLMTKALHQLGRHGEAATNGQEGDVYYSLIGRSAGMKKVFNLIDRIRESSVNVLIVGPSGSGKEMVAKALHDTSPRAKRKFVAINCSAIPDTLLEGELFGYKKGAFTDAQTDKMGLLQEAIDGTVFLDEIGDMPLSIQPKILRAIQEKEIRPLGSIQSVKIDVRIIAASNQNLPDLILEKKFREDLFYRLNAMQIELPSLRERREDIPLLVAHFLKRFQSRHGQTAKGVTDMALKKLSEYSWPGNVRELENVIERAALLAQGEWISPDDLLFQPEEESDVLPLADWAKSKKPLGDVEKEYIVEVLNSVGGNRSQTAKILGIGRKTLYNKLSRFKI